jgi:hypothetical protein
MHLSLGPARQPRVAWPVPEGGDANHLLHLCGWGILDRWALESPAQLRALESGGDCTPLGRLFEQQQLEHSMLASESALEQRRSGMADHEILVMNAMPTQLG